MEYTFLNTTNYTSMGNTTSAAPGEQQIPLKLSHDNLDILGIKKPTTFYQLLEQMRLFKDTVTRYFEGTGVFSELKLGDEDIAKVRSDAKEICLRHDTLEEITSKKETLIRIYGEGAVELAIEHFDQSRAPEYRLLHGAVEMELQAEKAEQQGQLAAALQAQIEAGKSNANPVL